MKKLGVRVQCMATYDSYIMVPDEMDKEEAIAYAKENVDKIPLNGLNYVDDSDQIDEENCRFEED